MTIWDKINDRRRWQGIVLWICVAALLVHVSGLLWPETLSITTRTRTGMMLMHGNTLHLIINMNALLIVAFRMYVNGWKWLCGYVISMSYQMNWTTVPIIGLSGLVYAVLGLMTLSVSRWRWMLTINMLTIMMSAVLPGIAWGIHAWSYGLGLMVSVLVEPHWRVKNDD